MHDPAGVSNQFPGILFGFPPDGAALFMAGTAAGFLFVLSLFRLWTYKKTAGIPVREYRCRIAAVFSILLSVVGMALPFVPGFNGADPAGTAAPSVVFLIGIAGFELSLALLLLIHQFPSWTVKQLIPLPLLALLPLLLPLSGEFTAPFVTGCFSLGLCLLCAAVFVYLAKKKLPRRSFLWGGLVFLALGSVFLLPLEQKGFFWPAVFAAWLLLEHRIFPRASGEPFALPSLAVSAGAPETKTASGKAQPKRKRKKRKAIKRVKPASVKAAAAPPVSGTADTIEAPGAEEVEELDTATPDTATPDTATGAEIKTAPLNSAVSRIPAGKPPVELPGEDPSVTSFIPREFLSILNKETVADLKLGDHIKQEMTIFFSDIRQFTDLSENLTPEENFAFINSYLSRIVPEITKNGGFVDKYIGDAILALFPEESGADMAVRTAIGIQEKLLEYNSHRAKCGYRPLSMGIGIHTGTLMVGVVGTEDRMQSTVISDAVNLASRVESLTKAFRVSLAISEETFKKLEDPGLYQYRFVGKVRVKGKSEPVSIFEIFDGVDENLQKKKIKANRFFEQGMFFYYQKKYADALQEFRQVLEVLPEDGASAFYIDNCMTKIKL